MLFRSEGAAAVPFMKNDPSAPMPVSGAVSFTDCVFDLTANAPAGDYALLSAVADTGGNIFVSITVCGGEIRANDLTGKAIANATGSNGFRFTAGENGYTTLLLPEGASAPETVYETDDGTKSFSDAQEEGEKVHGSPSLCRSNYRHEARGPSP